MRDASDAALPEQLSLTTVELENKPAPAPLSPRAALALRAAQALAEEEGKELTGVVGTPRWFQDFVYKFICSSEANRSALEVHKHPIIQEAKALNRSGVDAAPARRAGAKRSVSPAAKSMTWDCKYYEQLKRVEDSLFDKFAAQAAQAALDRKSAEDARARREEQQEAEEARARQEQRARVFETMKPLCLRCSACFDTDFGVTGCDMCGKHQQEFEAML